MTLLYPVHTCVELESQAILEGVTSTLDDVLYEVWHQVHVSLHLEGPQRLSWVGHRQHFTLSSPLNDGVK